MTSSEEKFIAYWEEKRKTWSWPENFKKGALYIAWPVVVLIDLINFFIIGDISYAFISLPHLFYLLFNLLWAGVLTGFAYGLYNWNINEIRYTRLMRSRNIDRTE